MMMLTTFLLLVISIALVSSAIVNYCDHGLCDMTDYKHITCEATGTLMPSCPSDARVVPLSRANIQQILDLHNQYRNELASGSEEEFDSAAKMSTIVSVFQRKYF
jgi:hypothetical protein